MDWVVNFPGILSVQRYGVYIDPDGDRITLLSIVVENSDLIERSRTRVRNFLEWYINHYEQNLDYALVALHSNGNDDWRFSFVYRDIQPYQTRGGRNRAAIIPSPAHRFSFLVGPNEPCHSAQIQIIPLLTRTKPPSFSDVKNAFSLDVVTDMFFKDYVSILERLEKNFAIQKPQIPYDVHRATAQQLLNRLMFTYFVQKKGWLANNKDYLKDQHTKYVHAGHRGNFYADFLKPFFFNAFGDKTNLDQLPLDPATLNEFRSMPYLNGGLFETNIYDGLNYDIPDNIVDSIFADLLDRYNFTIREDSPIDEEVAIDPEMLGKVYESLIFGDEQKGTLGIFYTPRTEIDYMCRQTLYNYFLNQMDLPKEKLLQLIHTSIKEIFTEDERKKLINLIDNISILDLTCGSGSFLVGILNVLLELKEKLMFGQEIAESRFQQIRRIIFNSLYGVDVKDWAVQVAYLRLWLKLILEAKEGDFDLLARPILPNLHLKIRQADSLTQDIGTHRLHFGRYQAICADFLKKKDPALRATARKLVETRDQLLDLKKLFFDSDRFEDIASQTLHIRELEKVLFDQILDVLMLQYEQDVHRLERTKQKTIYAFIPESDGKETEADNKDIKMEIDRINATIAKLQEIRKGLSGETILEEFLWELSFIEVFMNGGFSIVIGNPPYIKSQEITPPLKPAAKKPEKDEYKTAIIERTSQMWDDLKIPKSSNYLIYFYYVGLAILREKGIFTFVTSNSWLDDEYGAPFQEFLLKNMEIREITETREYRIFKRADINVCITIFSKDQALTSEELFENPVFFIQVLTDIKNINNASLFDRLYAMEADFRIFTEADIDENGDPGVLLLKVQKISQLSLYILGTSSNKRQEKAIVPTTIPEGKYDGKPWGALYFRTPPELLTLMEEHPRVFVPLESIVDFETYLNTGGADDFFFLTVREVIGDIARVSPQGDPSAVFEVESEFIVPFFKSPRGLNRIRLDASNTTSSLLVLPKDFLERHDHKQLRVNAFLEWGVDHGYNLSSGRKSKQDRWVILPDQAYDNAEIIVPLRMDQNHMIFYNPDKIISHRFFRLRIKPHLAETILLPNLIASLNSIFTYIFLEIYRNPSLGGGVLDISIPFLRQIQILDPALLNPDMIAPLLSQVRESGSIITELGYEQTDEYQIRPLPGGGDPIRATFDDAVRAILDITPAENEHWKELLATMIRNRKKAASVSKGYRPSPPD